MLQLAGRQSARKAGIIKRCPGLRNPCASSWVSVSYLNAQPGPETGYSTHQA